jgi:uncharacterized protein YjiS (DUF1127 family)
MGPTPCLQALGIANPQFLKEKSSFRQSFRHPARLCPACLPFNTAPDEMIMTTISTIPDLDKPLTTNRAAATLQRWWWAYRAWRIEQAAVTQLLSMSDHELKDIGICRCEVERAVSIRQPRSRARSL